MEGWGDAPPISHVARNRKIAFCSLETLATQSRERLKEWIRFLPECQQAYPPHNSPRITYDTI